MVTRKPLGSLTIRARGTLLGWISSLHRLVNLGDGVGGGLLARIKENIGLKSEPRTQVKRTLTRINANNKEALEVSQSPYVLHLPSPWRSALQCVRERRVQKWQQLGQA